MTPQHSEVFYYAIAVYALGAAAVLALPNGSEPGTETASQMTLPKSATSEPTAGAQSAKAQMAAKVVPVKVVPVEVAPASIRNSVSAQSSGFVFAGSPSKF